MRTTSPRRLALLAGACLGLAGTHASAGPAPDDSLGPKLMGRPRHLQACQPLGDLRLVIDGTTTRPSIDASWTSTARSSASATGSATASALR